jgi:hypothetical protein
MHDEHGGFWAETEALLRSGPHWIFEIISDLVVTVIVGGLLGRLLWPRFGQPRFDAWVARHDAQHHHGHTSTEEHTDA